jgi:hypothetical protein
MMIAEGTTEYKYTLIILYKDENWGRGFRKFQTDVFSEAKLMEDYWKEQTFMEIKGFKWFKWEEEWSY